MSRIANIYAYRDRFGGLLYEVVRYEPKDFRQRRPNGEGWIWNLEGVERVLFRLQEVLNSPSSESVYLVEGEKDVNTLIREGFVATCIAGGANAPWHDSYTEALRGRKVVLLPDNDTPGRAFMERVQSHLPQARVARLPNLSEKGDVTDFFNAGNTKEQFVKAVDDSLCETERLAAEIAAGPASGHPDAPTMATIPVKGVDWIWKPWIPAGKLCLIDGDPGQGKSFVTLDLCARLSRGERFPDGQPGSGEPLNSLLICCEDGFGDTVIPRLRALGADLDRIHGYQGKLVAGQPVTVPKLPDDLPRIAEIIERTKAKLVVIDPLMAFLGGSVNTVSDQSVRGCLTPLCQVAERTGAAILFVRHLNKTNGKQAIYRGGGSIGITGIMRSAMLIGRHPHDRDKRVLSMVKNNLEKEPKSLQFSLGEGDGGTVVNWEGAIDLVANDLVGDVKSESPRDWLREFLADSPATAEEVYAAGKEAGHCERILRTAKKLLGIKSVKKGDTWHWLPPGLDRLPSPARGDNDIFDLEPLNIDLPPLR